MADHVEILCGTGAEQYRKVQGIIVILSKLVQKAVQLIKTIVIWHQFLWLLRTCRRNKSRLYLSYWQRLRRRKNCRSGFDKVLPKKRSGKAKKTPDLKNVYIGDVCIEFPCRDAAMVSASLSIRRCGCKGVAVSPASNAAPMKPASLPASAIRIG